MRRAEQRTLVGRPALPPGPFLVAGLGRAGLAAADALRRTVGPDQVAAWDAQITRATRAARRRFEAAGVRTQLGPGPPELEMLRTFGTLVKSPGIAFDSALVRWAREAGLAILDEFELGWRLSSAPTVAVTGTNGKSTVAGLAAALLAADGSRVQLAGNSEFGSPLSAVAAEPSNWNVCEVSSFQLEGCPSFLPEIAVFTNLTREHLSRHRTMLSYGRAKRRLFVRPRGVVALAVIDVDGRFGDRLAKETEARGGRVLRVGCSAAADYRVVSVTPGLRRARVQLVTPRGDLRLETCLPGSYNARNVAAAVALADAVGVERSIAARVIAGRPGLPGRFEHVDEGQGFSAIVDFAHTPDAVHQFLTTVRAGLPAGGLLRTVFGRGGPAEASARRTMGSIVRSLSDEVIFTTSGYRGEPRIGVLADTLEGARAAGGGGKLEVVLDRRRAIERALMAAGEGDAVVIPGRGALEEISVDSRGGTIPFDDRTVTREALRRLGFDKPPKGRVRRPVPAAVRSDPWSG